MFTVRERDSERVGEMETERRRRKEMKGRGANFSFFKKKFKKYFSKRVKQSPVG